MHFIHRPANHIEALNELAKAMREVYSNEEVDKETRMRVHHVFWKGVTKVQKLMKIQTKKLQQGTWKPVLDLANDLEKEFLHTKTP